jgi:hypothetical protein
MADPPPLPSDSPIRAVSFRDEVSVRPSFTTRTFSLDSRLCFVIMPLTLPRLTTIYEECVAPVVTAAGLNPIKSDQILGAGAVIEDIWSSIYGARVMIAELTGRNANVFYELGIAHTVGVPVIPISQEAPVFDVAHIRHLIYEDMVSGLDSLRQRLRGTLEIVLGRAAQS